LIIKIQDHFQFGLDWYRGGKVRDLTLQYYFVLRSVLRANPCLRRCLTRCRHCGIYFLTHPCNAGRKDLGCPFGCREAHSKQDSAKRSMEYYCTPEGKFKKKLQNGKRSRAEAKAAINENDRTGKNLVMQDRRIGASIVCYLRVVIGLIDGRRVSAAEILEMLTRVMRQHSLCRRRKIDYVIEHLNERAP
jgi:hypothetical protein